MFWVAQVFGLGAMISMFLQYQQRKRTGIIACKLSADVFWVSHYLCLGAFSGIIPPFVGIFREFVFINRKTKKWASLIIWPFVFVAINWGLGLLTFKGLIDVLLILASSAVTISLWIDNPRLTKLISLPVALTFMIYDISIGSYIGAFNESIAITSIIISFIIEFTNKSKEKRK